MKKQRGTWAAILLILIVGISVTKFTRDYVAKRTSALMETAAFYTGAEDVPDTASEMDGAAAFAASAPSDTDAGRTMEQQEASQDRAETENIPEDGTENSALENPSLSDGALTEETAAAESSDPAAVPGLASAGPLNSGGAENRAGISGRSAVLTETETAPEDSGERTDESVTEPDQAQSGLSEPDSSEAQTGYENTQDVRCAGNSHPKDRESVGQTEETAENSGDSSQDTVKSPLESGTAETETEDKRPVTKADFEERFAAAEETAAQYGTSQGTDDSLAFANAENIRALWDKELNLVYSAIRAKMTQDEAENLKQEELSWMRARDKAAERAAAQAGQTGQFEKSTGWARTSGEKTRSRCYELLELYGDVLEREETEK